MKISVDWLCDFVDLSGISLQDLSDELSAHTAEVDSIEEVVHCLRGVLVGRIESTEPIEGHQGVAAVVRVGGAIYRTVCTATNARAGVVTAVALPGAVLSGGAIVGASTIAGRQSECVLCSLAELGIGIDHSGIVELPDDTPEGVELTRLLPERDILIDVDNKSLTHRPDLWGHYGIAREFSAIFGRPLKPLDVEDLSVHAAQPPVKIAVDATEECPYYSVLGLEIAESRPSPLRWQARLATVGSRPISLLVDLTNYVQFELGQPTHAFDASRTAGLRVAKAEHAFDFETLDGKSRRIEPEDLLIYDGDQPVAIAGIMGGLGTEVGPDTRALLLESANFFGPRVRKTSMRLGFRTDASARFEKRLPPIYAAVAPSRIVNLMRDTGCDFRVTHRLTERGDPARASWHIDLAPGFLSRRAGTEISDQKATELLEAIGFRAESRPGGSLRIEVPPFRSRFDISTPEDISEEVMRLNGYDQIVPVLPVASIRSAPLHNATRNHHRARRALSQSHGFLEVQTYGWFNDDWIAELGYEAPRKLLRLVNPPSPDRRHMRESLMPNLLRVVDQNRRAFQTMKFYELGKVFWLADDGSSAETNSLTGLVVDQTGRATAESVFRDLQAAIGDLFCISGEDATVFVRKALPAAPWDRTAATVEIRVGDRRVGDLGLLPKLIRSKVQDSGQSGWFVIDIDAIGQDPYPAPQYVTSTSMPTSTQDFTFRWPIAKGYNEIAAVLTSHPSSEVLERRFIDLYVPKGDSWGNYTFRFVIGRMDRALTREEIVTFRTGIIDHVQRFGGQILG